MILQNDFVIGLANNFMTTGDAWILMLVCLGIYAALQLMSLRSRKAAGLATDPPLIVASADRRARPRAGGRRLRVPTRTAACPTPC